MEEEKLNEKFEEHVINEYSEIRKVLESLAEESEEPEAGPSTSSSSDLGDQDKGVKEDVVENKAIVHTIRSLDDLPILTVEYILAQLGLADVMKMRLVSSKWNEVALHYIKKVENSFYPNLEKQHIQWVKVNEDVEDYMVPISSTPTAGCSHKRSRSVPRMSSRYHHSSCFINGEMYIFGGFTPSYTCFNDLWRFNYTTKTWRRIIAEGDLPLPRAYFSLNGYEQVNATTGETKYYLILFGGVLTDSSLAMSSRLLSTIHLFDIKENRWRLVNQQPEQQQRLQRNPHQIPLRPIIKAAGHKSIILGDEMIVANGCRMWEEIEVQHGYIAVFNLRTRLWTLQLSRGLSTPMAHFSHARYFRMFYETPMPFPAGFKINNHNILFLYSPWDDASKEAFLLQRKYCRTANCPLCQEQATKDNKPGCSRNNSDGEPRWTWHRCSFNDIENSDNAMRASGEMCQIGDLIVYISLKSVRPRPPTMLENLILRRPPGAAPGDEVSIDQRMVQRMRALDHYKSQYREKMLSSFPRLANKPCYRMKVNLLDTSHVLDQLLVVHKTPTTVSAKREQERLVAMSPLARRFFSLVATPESLLLFGGLSVEQQQQQQQQHQQHSTTTFPTPPDTSTNQLYMIIAKPQLKLN